MVVRGDVRPERSAPAENFYSANEAARYTQNARMRTIQTHLAQRALHLLGLPARGALILDLGCGTGYSGRVVEKHGHFWVGLDVSADMLEESRQEGRPCDQLCHDMGTGLPFRRRIFDGVISISAVQWLCVATKPEHNPERRLQNFFRGLKRVLVPGGRAALQVYPEDAEQMELIRQAALGQDFGGVFVADFPTSENSKKFFLLLYA
ncbi:S-adenosyl-L-methionine-dependent methyltransferase, partial [Pavlovales sp. CCMP2436]